jgi:hypothetical protein
MSCISNTGNRRTKFLSRKHIRASVGLVFAVQPFPPPARSLATACYQCIGPIIFFRLPTHYHYSIRVDAIIG